MFPIECDYEIDKQFLKQSVGDKIAIMRQGEIRRIRDSENFTTPPEEDKTYETSLLTILLLSLQNNSGKEQVFNPQAPQTPTTVLQATPRRLMTNDY